MYRTGMAPYESREVEVMPDELIRDLEGEIEYIFLERFPHSYDPEYLICDDCDYLYSSSTEYVWARLQSNGKVYTRPVASVHEIFEIYQCKNQPEGNIELIPIF